MRVASTRHRRLPAAIALSLSVLLSAAAARADWPPLGGTCVAVAAPPAAPDRIECASDGASGIYFGWVDARAGAQSYRAYARRIDGQGVPQWADGGLALNAAKTSLADRPAVAMDGGGGAIVVWRDFRADTAGDVYAQRLRADGSAQWVANGVAITSGPLHETSPVAVGDGAGGAYVAWLDDRTGIRDVRVQHVDATGALLWSAAGIVVSPPAATLSVTPIVAADGSGGVLVAWTSYNSGKYAPRAQRLTPAGTPLWTLGGVLLSTSTLGLGVFAEDIASDGAGGLIAGLRDDRSQNTLQQAFAQRVDASGAIAWAADGVSLSDPTWSVGGILAACDRAAGGILSWQTLEFGNVKGLHAQHVSPAGDKLWSAAGQLVASPSNGGGGPVSSQIVEDGAGGVVLAWNARRPDGGFDVLAQRLATGGDPYWLPAGRVLASLAHESTETTLVPDGTGGGVAGWIDTQNFTATYLVGAERIHGDGTLSVPVAPAAGIDLRGTPSPARASGAPSVRFTLARAGRSRVQLLDTQGRLVRELWNGVLPAGEQRLPWDGRDASGVRVQPGLYLVSLDQDGRRSSVRWVVID